MKHVHAVFVYFVVQYLKRIQPPVQAYEQVFFLVPGNRVIQQLVLEGKANVLLGNSMLKSRRVALDLDLRISLHALIIPRSRAARKGEDARRRRLRQACGFKRTSAGAALLFPAISAIL